MSLVWSFAHHCLAHPLLFVADVARAAGCPRLAALLEVPHELGADGVPPPPLSDDAGVPEPEPDETEGWPVPAQAPLTDAARAMMWRPPAPAPPSAPVEPAAGSLAARVQKARRAG